MALHSLSGNLVAVDATKYQLLRAAAKDSQSNWYQAQEYRRQLLAARKEKRVLRGLLAIASIMAIFVGVYR